MKYLSFCGVLLFLVTSSYSQETSVKGFVRDTSENRVLTNTVVLVMRTADSVITGFTRTNRTGEFMLKNIAGGQAFLMVIHTGFADYIDEITVRENEEVDLGTVFLTLKRDLLQEVVITNSWSIRMKGDTTEYKADSFHLRSGATAEDLLKKLPGIQVDRKGRVTAHGEKVEKILVDGEEFFSDDPTIVTRNLLSETINKVQVYDKKSDQATLTGIDDGNKSKTIDLKLKENRKKGYFGKIEGGTDAGKFWNNSAMLNAFKGKRKFSVYGIMSNTGKTGLDWKEKSSYAGGAADDGGHILNTFSGEGYYGEGISKVWTAGTMYANKWDEDKFGMNASYQYKKISTATNGQALGKYILPDTLYYIREKGGNYNRRSGNTINGRFEFQIDSSASLKLTAHGYIGRSANDNNNYSEALDANNNLVNTSNRRNSYEGDNEGIATNFIYQKKLKKAGRTLSLSLDQVLNRSDFRGFLNADYVYFDNNGISKDEQMTDQRKIKDDLHSSVNSRIVYTEPLSKKSLLEFDYSLNNGFGRSIISTLERTTPASQKYEHVIDSLSNNYSLNILSNSGGMNYLYSATGLTISFGGNLSKSDFMRRDIETGSSASYNFINVSPKGSLYLRLPSGSNLSLEYNGSTQSPSIDQLQPVSDNSDLLNQRIGNPDLKQAFRQNISMFFSTVKMLAERSFYVSIYYNTAKNDFSSFDYVDELGRRISKPVNVAGNYYGGFYAMYAKKFSKPDLQFQFVLRAFKRHNSNFINGLQNENNYMYFAASPIFTLAKSEKYEFSYSPTLTFDKSISYIRPDIVTKYITQEHYVSGYFSFPWDIQFNTDINFSLRQKTDAFDRNTDAVNWNAHIDKKVLKNTDCKLRLAAYNILDRNNGFQRNVAGNFISERTYDTIGRFFMLSLIYNFNKSETSE